ncbi:hypothetical protein Q0590_25420 [Rhodocytophaga aerolata]|uniref:Uncharacterized protein n=1 Tax=Rhodocytophaga aerolata TaxID=455078 RepID=A0ABT8RC14_9BACT|nr:hypothetical protein [Rhodocytophaga aerolata]MDO1449643.1 hypothetical protein [Rhodocytophaga aerolata]
MKNVKIHQPWIYAAAVDLVFILSPPFLSLFIIFLLPVYFQNNTNMPSWAWLVLVLLVDVAHVYSTLYRTYFDKETFTKQRNTLIGIPFFGWIAGAVVYSIDDMLFWRLLAYIAVFHFIRQQYGFMRIYSRKEQNGGLSSGINMVATYTATLYPIIFWHVHTDRNFNWFIKGDFYFFESEWLSSISGIVYWIIIGVYLAKETITLVKHRTINIPSNLIIIGTYLSWYFGIVYFNGDLAFTLLNVVSHGIPYMALVWIYGRKKYHLGSTVVPGKMSMIFTGYGILVFLLLIFLLAYVEEGLWNALVWNDHPELFQLFMVLPKTTDKQLLSFLVPFLALPQITHYILDGFIWKISKDSYNWKNITLESELNK